MCEVARYLAAHGLRTAFFGTFFGPTPASEKQIRQWSRFNMHFLIQNPSSVYSVGLFSLCTSLISSIP